jgi:UDP-N-acetylglucosamine--N-acetylmuramyl-(pentapeptide) pyrophosphoryl-undecaprenol N-acetylglucosamine transferase
MISPKEVDQQAIRQAEGVQVVTLPAVGLKRWNALVFARGAWSSYRTARQLFASTPPDAVLAMGGFTSAAPVLAGRRIGARTFLHESNLIPGRANRWLAPLVTEAFVGFPGTIERLRSAKVRVTGTPVRSSFAPRSQADCRRALGLDPNKPVVLVMGGSQGAGGINKAVVQAMPVLARQGPDWQWLHLTGPNDAEVVREAYTANGRIAAVHPFFSQMEIALGAATAAISRAGASSLAELAAMRVPALLIPYPHATDNHQWHNARVFCETGAAVCLPASEIHGEALPRFLALLVEDEITRAKMKAAMAQWHAPHAAEQIAGHIFAALNSRPRGARAETPGQPAAKLAEAQS